MALRDTLRKAAGLLVEFDPQSAGGAPGAGGEEVSAEELQSMMKELKTGGAAEPAAAASVGPKVRKTVEQIVKDAPGPNLDEIKLPEGGGDLPYFTPEGGLNQIAIYKKANVPAVTFTAEQMLEMIKALPAELPLDTKRQTVKVSLNSMGRALGATPDAIVTDASRKLAAIAAFADWVAQRAAKTVAESELEIAGLQKKIQEKKDAIRAAQEQQAKVARLCEAETDRLDDILEFFSLDLPPSKYAAGGGGGGGR